MAIKSVVIDTGPLILLAKTGLLPVVGQLPYRFVIPGEVIDELKAGDELGHQAVDLSWLHVKALQTPIPVTIQATLDLGEAAVIQLALENGIDLVCLDDLRGRRIAKAVGFEVIGLLGLLGKAKRRGHIPALFPCVEKLLAAGARYSPELIAQIIADVDNTTPAPEKQSTAKGHACPLPNSPIPPSTAPGSK